MPFAVLIDTLDHYLRTLGPDDLDRLSADRLGALAAVFPSLEVLGAAVDIPVNAGERFRVHRAVGELIERLAARQPVLLVLDDLQWADPASLELAAHLARRRPDGAVMIVFGVRSGVTTESARRSLAGIETANDVLSIRVPPLDRPILAELVGCTEAADIDRWYELTRGNPFFALQLARTDPGPGREFALDDVPNAVQGAIRIEFDALSDQAQEVAATAAVVGDPFDLDLVIERERRVRVRGPRWARSAVSQRNRAHDFGPTDLRVQTSARPFGDLSGDPAGHAHRTAPPDRSAPPRSGRRPGRAGTTCRALRSARRHGRHRSPRASG